MSDAPQGSSRPRPFEALAAVARTLGETLDLRQVFARVADAARTALPFERMRIVLLEGDGAFRMYATEQDGAPGREDGTLVLVEDLSPQLWHEFVVERIDVRRQLDPSFRWDRETIESGHRSIVRAMLRIGDHKLGVLAFASRQPDAFTDEHESIVLALAGLVAAALEHQRMWTEEHLRRERGDGLERLLPTLAKSMDVREIFQQISEVSQDVICHDIVGLAFLSPDGKSLPVYALSDGSLDHLPAPPVLPEQMRGLQRGFFIMQDVSILDRERRRVLVSSLSADQGQLPPREIEMDPARFWLVEKGIRSWVTVPVRSRGEISGTMLFGSRRPNAYDTHDADLARRVADHVALALAYQRMAEEARNATEAREHAATLETRVQTLKREIDAISGYGRVVGESAAWKSVLKLATQVAVAETTVLLLGESGTGKEVVARYVHRASPRSGGPFVALNCAALPEHLFESELFGFERGAFTGATQAKPGQIELAAGGVLFLDEIAEMSLSSQAKLLRVLEERQFQRLGGTRALTADVRIIAATNRELPTAIERGTFREDLYYRLQVFEIRMPPLRERPEDILPLSEGFLADLGRTLTRPPGGVSREARALLMEYSWPGNVRELRNILERAAILCEGGLITAEHLTLPVSRVAAAPRVAAVAVAATPPVASAPPVAAAPPDLDLLSTERMMVVKALEKARYNKSKAARALGLTRTQLYVRLRRHGLN